MKLGLSALIIFGSTLMITGCAKNWTNPEIADASIEKRELAMADGYCTQVAMGAAPMPDLHVQQQPSAYSFNGQARTFGESYSSTSYSGTITPIQSPGNAFVGGLGNGMALGQALRASRAQDKIHDSCMMRLGWQEGSRSAPPAQMVRAASVSTPATSSRGAAPIAPPKESVAKPAVTVAASMLPSASTAQTNPALVQHRVNLGDRTAYGRLPSGAQFVEYYAPDGRSAYREGACQRAGQWASRDDGAICFRYPSVSPKEACFKVISDDAGERFFELNSSAVNPSLQIERWIVGNPEHLALGADRCRG